MTFTQALQVVVSLELRQRVRARSWYILLGVYALVIAGITGLLLVALPGFGGAEEAGGGALSTIVFFVLLLGSLVTPALSGNAINGDRADGILATTQVTQVTTAALVIGKFLASWISALAFLAVSAPFLLVCFAVGGVRGDVALGSIAVLVFELGVIAAIGVGLSGLLARPLFSIVVTYLAVAALSVGSIVVFVLAGIATQTTVTSESRYPEYSADGSYDPDAACGEWQSYSYQTPRFDPYWPILMANPYVLLADATPTAFDAHGNATDLFGALKSIERGAQIPPETTQTYDGCAADGGDSDYPTSQEIIDSTVPGWFVGGAIHLLLAGGLLAAGASATRTPARRLAGGSRIA